VGMFCPFSNISAVVEICNYRTTHAHFDRPSTSSSIFNRFLCLFTVLANSCSEGERSAPLRLSWWLSPRAAWSYFSTAVILSNISDVVEVDFKVFTGYVELSFNCPTMSSISCTRSCSLVVYSVRAFSCAVCWVGSWVGVDRVFCWLVVSFAFAFSASAVFNFPASSSTSNFRWSIYPCIILFTES
jgi:hypothetical protein